MPTPQAYYEAFARPPFLFAVTGARALPAPVLVELMGQLDGSVSATRTVLKRLVAAGGLELTREGGVGRYRLADATLRAFEAFRDRRPPEPWSGRFHTLVHDVPERQRTERERFLVAAERAGYRPMRAGVLLGVRDTSDTLTDHLATLDITPGWLEVDADAAAPLVARCWQLDALRAEVLGAVAEGEDVLAATPEPEGPGALAALARITGPLTGLALRGAGLPAELLPGDWPSAAVESVLDRAHDHLLPAASDHARATATASAHAPLVEWA